MRQFLRELRDYKLAILIVILTVFGSSFGNLSLPTYIAEIINDGIANANYPMIWRTGIVMFGYTVLTVICAVITSYYAAKISAGVGRSLRTQIFNKVEDFSLAEINEFSAASLITRTNNDVVQVTNFVLMALRIALMAPIIFVAGLILAFSKSPEMSRILFLAMPILAVVVGVVARKALPLSKLMQQKLDRLNLVMREKLTGIRVIRAFGTEEYERKRFARVNQDLATTTLKMQRLMMLLMPAAMLVCNFTVVVLVWQGGHSVPVGNIEIGDVIAVIQYVMQIMMAVMMLSMIFVMYPRAAASIERINEVLNVVPEITDPPVPAAEPTAKGYVTFENVSFAFPDSIEPVLDGISFAMRPGETTAVIGSTGSGKTALANLIPRFYDVTAGQILVDGVDVRDYDQHVLRGKIGYVPQKSLLFSGDIDANLRFGMDEVSEERLQRALEIAQAADFVAEKPEGIHAPISQGGSNVSGGQRQRLAIARAIVKQPEIYIFDDSFSALDFKTDAALRRALAAETAEAAVLIIAQRVGTIKNADQILVLDEGRIVGKGTHESLIADCPTYREIVNSQLSAEEVAL